MRQIYAPSSADLPRLSADTLFFDPANSYSYLGFVDDTARHIERVQLSDATLWHRFVSQFRADSDGEDAGWRGEYWGKMMRGACFVYAYTKSPTLYQTLRTTVLEMLESADSDGRISTYGRNREFRGWDIWSRKYVLLGLQYFMDICPEEELNARILASLCAQADYIIERIGDGEKKIPITHTAKHWRGLNSSSILEPIVRLYNRTGEQKYLNFASYIVELGATDISNIFELAYQNDFAPYQYPITKAYEMISCFEGLLEYYRVTKSEHYKTAVLNFAERVLEGDYTVIGCSGCTHELFDHSTVRQANTTNGVIMQETCVSVTLMKFFWNLLSLTGETKYADAFERTFYNAYLGALNTESVIEPTIAAEHPDWKLAPLPFDSYSPLTAGTRGNGVGGLMLMSDMHYYGCCACISPAGIGLLPKIHLMAFENGLACNLYIAGSATASTPGGQRVTLITDTDYPVSGEVKITLSMEAPEEMALSFRIPAWSRETRTTVNGEALDALPGYFTIKRIWRNSDIVTLSFDMRTEIIRPIPYGTDILMNHVIWKAQYVVPSFDREDPLARHHFALRRGPLMLAIDERLGLSADTPIFPATDGKGYAEIEALSLDTCPYPAILYVALKTTDGKAVPLTDYSSAGKTWNKDSRMAVWLRTE